MTDQRTENGAYDLEGIIWHQHSPQLMEKILKMWTDKSVPVIDLGCGLNYYVTVLNCAGYQAWGYDAIYLGHLRSSKMDLTKPLESYDGREYVLFGSGGSGRKNVLSLEVGEHIPSDKADVYLDNVANSAKGGDIILSWAVPGQAGVGHINCRENRWVSEEMDRRGYKMNRGNSYELRMAVRGSHCSWFVNTLMYFEPTWK